MNIEQQKDFEEMVRDVHAKMIDSELMEKYQLSAAGLKSVLYHLVETKVLTRAELHRRPILIDDSIDAELRGHLPRHRLAFLFQVVEDTFVDVNEPILILLRDKAHNANTVLLILQPLYGQMVNGLSHRNGV